MLIGGLLVLPAGPIIGLVFFLWISAWVIERDRAYDWRQWQSSAAVSVAAHLILIAGLLLLPATAIIGLVFLGWIFAWLRERDRTYDWGRWRTPGAISAAVHIVLIAALLLMPESMTTLRVYESKADSRGHPALLPHRTDAECSEQRKNQQGTIGRSRHAHACVEVALPASAREEGTRRCAAPAADREGRAETGDRRAAKNRGSRNAATGADRKTRTSRSATAASGPAAETATGERRHASDRRSQGNQQAIRRRESRCRTIRSMRSIRDITKTGTVPHDAIGGRCRRGSVTQTAWASIFRRPPAGRSRAWNWPAIPWAPISGPI